jgi:hypothetical protein
VGLRENTMHEQPLLAVQRLPEVQRVVMLLLGRGNEAAEKVGTVVGRLS